jgi:two-component system, NtrC family, sensor kinase
VEHMPAAETTHQDLASLAGSLDGPEPLLQIVEQSPQGVLLVNQDFQIEYANLYACEIMDAKPGALTGKSLLDLFGEEFRSAIPGKQQRVCTSRLRDPARAGDQKVLDRVAELFQRGANEYNVKTFEGMERIVEVTGAGQIGRYSLWYLCDITARRQLEVELQYRDTFFHNLIDSSVDGIIAADMKGRIILFNSGAQNILGYTREEAFRTLHVTQLYPEGDSREIIKRMRSDDFGGKGKLLRHELIAITKDGTQIPMSLSGGIIYDGDKEMASYGIFTDLRAIRKAEEDLEQTHQMLLQSEKMAGLGRLAAGVAHEINNPMSGIMLYANLAKEQLGDEHPATADLEIIAHEADRCKQIVADLLEFSHQTSYEQTGVSLGHQIQKALSVLEKQPLFHNIEVNLDVEAGLSRIHGNPIRLNQVFMNLIVNAAQAMEGNGKLDIQARHRSNEDIVEVLFRDTGPGITEEIIKEIFDPFFTTKTDQGGTGLGLSVSYAIVREHKGSIRVTSEVGQGTTFTLRFPALKQNPLEDES